MPVFKRRKPDGSFESEPDSPAVDPGARRAETGAGVPPFRPATLPASLAPASPAKEAPAMSRSPFPASSPVPSAPPPPGAAPRAPLPGQMPPGQPGAGMGGMAGAARAPARDPGERRTLVVGRGISVQGTVQDAERLVVEGTVEATMIHATELAISPGGMFKGEVEVEDAEVAGTIDGTLTARGALIVRATGKLLGSARCRRLQVEDGGQITGRIEMLSGEPASRTETVRAPAEAAAG